MFGVGLLVSGCASPGNSPVDATRYETMSCVELNQVARKTSAELSQIAITRGKAEDIAVPSWLPGGSRLQASYADRQTAKIEKLRQQQQFALSARKGKC